ncbi:hypothetical protein [Pedobacter gandavensis]|uniref:hypothetical protein n=1 Tax=Pedobacter gandavensis TaxID=2679963 RepID=UPI00292E2985|nr:hypothetical protein [Pedobacter gandavensis]
MKIKTHLTYALLFCALGTTVISCSKDKEESAPVEIDSKINPDKLKRIEKFMMTMFGISSESVKYNEAKEIFYIHETTMSRTEMETIYDNANEYKLKYEKN